MLDLAVHRTLDMDTTIAEVKDLHTSNNLAPTEIYDFYWLYFPRTDLRKSEFQHNRPESDRSIIDTITRDRIDRIVTKHGNLGIT